MARAAAAASPGATMRARPRAGGPVRLPCERHGAIMTVGSRRIRFTFPALAWVTTTMPNFVQPNHSGVATGTPERRKVVRETKRFRVGTFENPRAHAPGQGPSLIERRWVIGPVPSREGR